MPGLDLLFYALGALAVIVGVFFYMAWRNTCDGCSKNRFFCECEPDDCEHIWWRWRWSQDGFVRQCKICGAMQYGGDDYDGGPNASGNVEG